MPGEAVVGGETGRVGRAGGQAGRAQLLQRVHALPALIAVALQEHGGGDGNDGGCAGSGGASLRTYVGGSVTPEVRGRGLRRHACAARGMLGTVVFHQQPSSRREMMTSRDYSSQLFIASAGVTSLPTSPRYGRTSPQRLERAWRYNGRPCRAAVTVTRRRTPSGQHSDSGTCRGRGCTGAVTRAHPSFADVIASPRDVSTASSGDVTAASGDVTAARRAIRKENNSR